MEEISYIGLAAQVDSSRHPQWERMASYAWELSGVEMDVQLIRMNLLERYYDVTSDFETPESPIGLILKKFLIAHSEEDICHRLYAYREKLHQFLNAALLAGYSEQERELGTQVRKWLQDNNEGSVLARLEAFGKDKFGKKDAIGRMIDRRHALTHRLPVSELAMIGRPRRLAEWLFWDQEQKGLLDLDEYGVAASTFQVDAYCTGLRLNLEQIEEELWTCETGLCRELLGSLNRRGFIKDAES